MAGTSVIGYIAIDEVQIPIYLLSIDDKCTWKPDDYDYRNDLVSHCIYADHTWEPYQTEIQIELFKQFPSATFIDIGAHVGYYSLIAKHFGLNVVCYEANPDIHAVLSRNVGSDNAVREYVNASTPILCGVGESVLIKLDVEGSEPEIVDALVTSGLAHKIQAIIVEVSPKFREIHILLRMIRQLQSLGLQAYDIGLSPRRALQLDTQWLPALVPFDLSKLADIQQTNILFTKR